MEFHWRGKLWDTILPDDQDLLYYTSIGVCTEQQKDEFRGRKEKAKFAPLRKHDTNVTMEKIHARFGHPGKSRTKALSKDLTQDYGFEIKGKLKEDCAACDLAKSSSLGYPSLDNERRKKTKTGEKWAHDLSGPVNVDPIGFKGHRYRSIMTDYRTGYYEIELLIKLDGLSKLGRIQESGA